MGIPVFKSQFAVLENSSEGVATRFCQILSLVLLGAFAVQVAAQSTLDRIVAVIDNDVIMESELAIAVADVARELRRSSAQVPDRTTLVKGTLEDMINERVLLHEAERRGVRVGSAEVDAAVQQIATQNNIGIDRLSDLLEKDGVTLDDYRESLSTRLMVQRLVDSEINRRVNVTDDEIEMALQQQAREGSDEAGVEYRLKRILIGMSNDGDELEKEIVQGQAERIRDQLSKGANFSDIAAEYSIGSEATNGGDLGWREASKLPTLYLEVLSSMKAGETSPVIEGPNGFHILKIDEVRGGRSTIVDEYRVRQIQIRSDDVLSNEELSTRISSIRERIVQGEDFAQLARAHSEDARTQSNGGDMGWITLSGLPRAIAQAISKLSPGQISLPVETEFGMHLFQLIDKRQQDATELVERDLARQKLLQRKSEELYSRWSAELRARAYVELRLDSY